MQNLMAVDKILHRRFSIVVNCLHGEQNTAKHVRRKTKVTVTCSGFEQLTIKPVVISAISLKLDLY